MKGNAEMMEMTADMVKNLAMRLMRQDKSMTMEQALGIVFNSDTYRKLTNARTGLYFQSPVYVFSFLESELEKGKAE